MSSDSKDPVLVKRENGVAWITLNRPEVLNACDIATLKKLNSVLKEVETDQSTRCVVITGSGRAFCAGADLQSLAQRGNVSLDDDLKEGFNPVCSRIFNMEKPVIAMINGVAAGAGMGIAFACDLRIMSEGARFVEAFGKVGLVPDSGATFTMPRLLGITKAMELAFTGEAIDASEADRMGIVNKIVPGDKLESETRTFAEKLAKGPKGLGLSKRAIHKALSLEFDSALEYEAELQQVAGSSEDNKEGVIAFREKRNPNFTGR
ncbi:MAG: enoyl-CoA hydratase/isomerase family protein [Thaumarchaeota archaeon]|nr:enoyl-CoA hydratase/isomerase family protein [Nitrososphaerota archaeon]